MVGGGTRTIPIKGYDVCEDPKSDSSNGGKYADDAVAELDAAAGVAETDVDAAMADEDEVVESESTRSVCARTESRGKPSPRIPEIF